jgi:hypothetical protein
VGFCIFPVGWSWVEYQLLPEKRSSHQIGGEASSVYWSDFSAQDDQSGVSKYRERPLTYEASAQKGHLLGIDVDATKQTQPGKEAVLQGSKFRRQRVENYFHGIIRRKQVPLTIYKPDGRAQPLSDELRLHALSRVHVEENYYGFPPNFDTCSIDALELTKVVETHRWQGERDKTHDWLRIERIIRVCFETYGCADSDAKNLQ